MAAVNTDLMLQEMLNKTAGKVNQIVYWSRPLDWHNQTLTPNPDAIYLMAFFNTKDAGPIVLEIPAAGSDGSLNANIVDFWQIPLEDAGPAGADAGKGGKYLVLPPGYAKSVPKGYIVLRDTLYSAAVFDLDAGPVTITLPDAGKRFMSLQLISQDEYSPPAEYGAGKHTITRQKVGTRYVLVGVRTLVDPSDPADIKKVHALQDGIKAEQKSPGKFEVPKRDPVSQKKVRDALIVLATTLTDTSRAFGTKDQVDPVQRLISAASTWGGNPKKDAIYLNFTPAKNDGKTIYKLTVKDVPVDGFWSISLYNGEGYYQKNDLNVYSLNNITSKKSADGSVAIQFGGCDGKIPNCLPIMAGWNYTARLYRPRAEILNGKWTFPDATPAP